MARYIDAELALKLKDTGMNYAYDLYDLEDFLEEVPTADVVEVKTIKDWLFEISKNNVGNYLGEACIEIITRLDGLRKFAEERKTE